MGAGGEVVVEALAAHRNFNDHARTRSMPVPTPPDPLDLLSGRWPCVSHRIVAMDHDSVPVVEEVYAYGEYLWMATYRVTAEGRINGLRDGSAEIVRARVDACNPGVSYCVAD